MNIQLSVKEILSVLEGSTSHGVEPSFSISAIKSLSKATDSDMAVILDRGDASVFDSISPEAVMASSAGVILASKVIAEGKKYILVPDALQAFEKLTKFVQEKTNANTQKAFIDSNTSVHQTAVISPGAKIGKNSTISAHVFIGHRCTIGNNTLLYPNVTILDDCIIGDNTIIHSGAVVGSDGFGYQVSNQGLKKIPQVGIVRVGSNVEIGAQTTIDRAAFDETIIGDNVKIDNLVHIAHNVIIGPHTAIIAQTAIAGSVTIGYGCQIGGQVGIRDHVTIGNRVNIVSKSAVMNNINDGETVAGIPAIKFSEWKRLTVCLAKVPEIIKTLRPNKSMHGTKKSWWQRLFG